MLSAPFVSSIEQVVGAPFVTREAKALEAYGVDALRRGQPPELVVWPATTAEVAAVARLCDAARVPLTARGGGTGYTGGAVPTRGGVVLSLERLSRIIQIDEPNLLAIVEPNVVTADLQRAVEAVGLFYPPDPASAEQSVIGGNVAECAGGPRAFKYGTTKRYILGTGSRTPDRRDRSHGWQGGEERGRLRSDPTARRLGGDAGDHHADHRSSHSEAASAGDTPCHVSRCDDRCLGGDGAAPQAGRTLRRRDRRRRLLGGGRAIPGRVALLHHPALAQCCSSR